MLKALQLYIILFIGIMILNLRCKNLNSNSGKNKEAKDTFKQEQVKNDKFSASTKLFLKELDKEVENNTVKKKLSQNFVEDFNLIKHDSIYSIGVVFKTNDSLKIKSLKKYEVKIGTETENFLTGRVPILKLEKLKSLEGLEHIKVDEKNEPKKE